MRIESVAFTRRGLDVAARLARGLVAQGDEVRVSCPARLAGAAEGEGACHDLGSLDAWAAEAFERADALLFVCACGIAVRSVAPHVRDKMDDPAVVCVDEGARFAVPLLSGHVGGANELARRVSALCEAQPVVTTATDVGGVFAVDEWARAHDLAIVERDLAKRVSAALLEGSAVGFSSDCALGAPARAGLVPCDGRAPADKARPAAGGDVPELGICVSLDAGRAPFARTLHLVPRVVTVGVGCRRGASSQSILALVDACLAQARVAPQAVRAIASIDVKANEEGLLAAARERGWELRFYGVQELAAVPGEFSSSAFVRSVVGVDNVCERAACAGGGRLVLAKQGRDGVTVALCAAAFPAPARLRCVGLGPGAGPELTLRAREALRHAEVIVGYRTYVDLIRDDYPQAEFVETPMRGEVERCRMALGRAAAGQRVAMVCSGDPGVYGMAGLLLELAPEYPGVEVEVVPGVSAANGGAALLGAPLMHDWCSLSLSDLMTPWEKIEARLRAAAEADLCICLYNPASHGRAHHLRRACDVLLEARPARTVCGIARNVGRAGEATQVLTLGELRDAQVDMVTCVFVGNAQTRVVDGRMVTPRGYLQREG